MRDGNPVSLGPKVLETLLLLVENAGHLVDKDELMKRVWPDAFVEEGRQRLAAPCCDEQPDRAAGERQQQALGEELANQARAAGAKRHADGDLAPAARRAREQ